MTAIRPHLSSAELEQGYRTATEPIAKSHFHALWLLSRGYDIDETAEILSFSTRWLRILIKRYNEGGPSQLGDQRANNGTEPTILTPAALGKLKERLQTLPDDGGQWTGPKIARWLAGYHGLESVHDQRGWDALIAIGCSIQQPRPQHPDTATEQDRTRLKKSSSALRPPSAASIPTRRSRSGRRTSIAWA
jgi:transposase